MISTRQLLQSERYKTERFVLEFIRICNVDARKHVTNELKGDVMVIRINTPGSKVSEVVSYFR